MGSTEHLPDAAHAVADEKSMKKKKVTCHYCKERGHISKDCEKRTRDASGKDAVPDGDKLSERDGEARMSVTCHYCQERGHIAKDCDQKASDWSEGRLAGKRCHYCKEIGHISTACEKKVVDRMQKDGQDEPSATPGAADAATAADGAGSKPSDKKDKGKKCFVCGTYGHVRSDCPVLREKRLAKQGVDENVSAQPQVQAGGTTALSDSAESGDKKKEKWNPAKNKRCFGCGEFGHFHGECPINPYKPDGAGKKADGGKSQADAQATDGKKKNKNKNKASEGGDRPQASATTQKPVAGAATYASIVGAASAEKPSAPTAENGDGAGKKKKKNKQGAEQEPAHQDGGKSKKKKGDAEAASFSVVEGKQNGHRQRAGVSIPAPRSAMGLPLPRSHSDRGEEPPRAGGQQAEPMPVQAQPDAVYQVRRGTHERRAELRPATPEQLGVPEASWATKPQVQATAVAPAAAQWDALADPFGGKPVAHWNAGAAATVNEPRGVWGNDALNGARAAPQQAFTNGSDPFYTVSAGARGNSDFSVDAGVAHLNTAVNGSGGVWGSAPTLPQPTATSAGIANFWDATPTQGVSVKW